MAVVKPEMNSGKQSGKMFLALTLALFAIPLGLAAGSDAGYTASPMNEESRSIMNVDPVHDAGTTGNGLSAAMWGFGMAGNHEDLSANNGLVQKDNDAVSAHPTHVAGTMAGQGILNPDNKGVAPAARILSYALETSSTSQLISETADAQDGNSVVSHNSWAWGDMSTHGNYDSFSKAYDRIARGTASGMDRGMSVVFPSANHRNDVDRDYNTIPGTGATAKNSITVGAVDRNMEMTSFSSWGPTDNGRLKPDLVANGQFVKSTVPGNGYSYKRGTSVAAPAVSGGVVLVNDAFQSTEGRLPDPATVKAILIHNAQDVSTEGPDYRTGWGVPDLERSVQLIEREETENVLEKGKFESNGQTETFTADFSDRGGSHITLVWSDKAGSNGELVNDLDLNVKDSSGNELEPWSLDSLNPEEAAEKGEDHTNPVEQVEIPDNTGEVEITVEAESLQDSQSYSLVSDAAISKKQEQKDQEDTTEPDNSDEETVNEEDDQTSGDEENTNTDNSGSDDEVTETGSPELEIVSPEKKTYRDSRIEFRVETGHVSNVNFDLGGETYEMTESADNTYTREVGPENGFQTVQFEATGDNGETVINEVMFYSGTGLDSTVVYTDSGSDNSDNEDQNKETSGEDSDSSEDEESTDDSGTDDKSSEDDEEHSDSSNDETQDSDSGEEDTSGDGTDSSSGSDDSTDDSSSDDSGSEDESTVDEDKPLSLEIISPESGQGFGDKTTFKVKFNKEVESAKLTLNRRKTHTLEKNGDYYSGEYSLSDGLNTMMFMGTDKSGNFQSKTLTVRK